MLARFFIDRPVLAWVISIVIVLLGAIAAGFLPIAEYPEITPPTVRVTASYPGANAKVVADTVAAPIEQQVVGVEGMMYMSSQSNNDGTYTLDVTFELGTNVNMAQVLVQNRVAIAEPTLPDVVRTIGVAVKKRSPDVLLGISLYSDDNPETGRPYYDSLYLSNYATIQVKDAVARVEGVGDVAILGQQDYSMRVWLDPDKLQSRNLTAGDVIRVLREQNVQVAAGRIGQPPVPNGQDFQYTLSTLGRLVEAEQFADIILNTGSDGEVTYLRDVSRTDLGARNQDTLCRLDGRPSPAVVVFLLPGANALDTADGIKATMRELETRFPKGLRYLIGYDTTPFIRESVNEVFHTLRDSVILVAIVILLFLQDWKALLLPVIDMAVSLVGTFAVMSLLGFTLNNLTLFGLVLAIGLVVDDAIVVLENIERWLDKGLPVREATIAGNERDHRADPRHDAGAQLGAGAQRLPGRHHRPVLPPVRRDHLGVDDHLGHQRHDHDAGAGGLDFCRPQAGHARRPGQRSAAVVELRLVRRARDGVAAGADPGRLAGPARGRRGRRGGARRPPSHPADVGHRPRPLPPRRGRGGALLAGSSSGPVNWALGKFFRGFNWVFERTTQAYGKTVGRCLRQSAFVLLVYVALIGLTGFGFTRVPSGFVPIQDKGYLVVNIQLPDSASLERTVEVTEAVEKIALETPGVAHTVAVPGLSFVLNANSSNYGNMFVILKPFHERQGTSLTGEAIVGRLRGTLSARGPGGPRARLRAAGGAWPRQRRRLQADGGSDRRTQLRRAAGPRGQPGRQGEPAARLGRPVQRLPRPDASALRGHRPDQGPDDGGGDHRRLRCAAGIPGQLLRQRLQPLRPHLAGERPGRRSLPRGRGNRQTAQGPQRRRRHGAAGRRRGRPRVRRPGDDHAL